MGGGGPVHASNVHLISTGTSNRPPSGTAYSLVSSLHDTLSHSSRHGTFSHGWMNMAPLAIAACMVMVPLLMELVMGSLHGMVPVPGCGPIRGERPVAASANSVKV